mmetsp:Transcript_92484/g.164471  ORF Transcript_92484/g.164471 Transcript_92484/m.164471 type:complete len:128 (-) Transcript_92484:128-511(-)|eukprot:CAMPEP_0197704792 /NCGR_PEP_ID=MMETSP1338-20131121/126117_1 /TAXON_ID=43686 ORGANISM="Pelagodinium beii, Strain RCC1491" /NCGR_SAMPLE_ID=MMETSP1338 /ASSEMBLY_ACC=CAM_ASM_000754 /LENGTH=127 /DNA_ID=CAMNT_0043288695 /DNA_START=21 /DNA_END=404 /DNA_ORIENTATION=+
MVRQFFPLYLLISCTWSVGAAEKALPGDNSVLLQHPLSGSSNATLQKDARAAILIEDESNHDEQQGDTRALLSGDRRRECKNRRRRRDCDKKCKNAFECGFTYCDGYCAATTAGDQKCVSGLLDCSR